MEESADADLLREMIGLAAERTMDTAKVGVLAYMRFPTAHRIELHSPNPPERLDGGIKRPTEVVGIFPDEAAIARLVGAILLEQDNEWAVQRSRYTTLEASPRSAMPPLVGLPALASWSSRPKPVIVMAIAKLNHPEGHDLRSRWSEPYVGAQRRGRELHPGRPYRSVRRRCRSTGHD